MDGIRVLKHLLKPKLTLIGVEDNKPAAIGELTRHATDEDVLVKTVPTSIPLAAPSRPSSCLPAARFPGGPRRGHGHHGAQRGHRVCHQARHHRRRAAHLPHRHPHRRRLQKPGNAWVLLGTPVRWLLQRFELQPEADQRVIMGGPMMGFTLPHAMVPVVKATNCLSPTRAELPPPGPEQACIRCSACADACPANLLPQELYWYSRAKEYDKAEGLNLFDCIECGACAWVCPSEIPLVQYYKIARMTSARRVPRPKGRTRQAALRGQTSPLRAGKSRPRSPPCRAAAQRRQAMTAAGGEDPVAAALARIKANRTLRRLVPANSRRTTAP